MKKTIIILFFLCSVMFIYTQDDFGYEENISVIMAENEAFEGILSLWFTEAETGKAIDSASIVINKIGKYTSDKNGLIYFKIPKNGKYTFTFNKDGYGPETITITELDNSAEYLLYIHNYSDNRSPRSRFLSESKAIVRVYNNNELLRTIKSKEGMQGVFWHVFDIKNGQINTLNKYSTK